MSLGLLILPLVRENYVNYIHNTFGSDIFEAVSQQDFLMQKIKQRIGMYWLGYRLDCVSTTVVIDCF